MTMTQLRDKAGQLGVKAGKMRKVDLVRAIQQAEGFTPCYGTPNGFCDQTECCFRDDCYGTKMIVSDAPSNEDTCKTLVLMTEETNNDTFKRMTKL